jgi:hypothetical protein
VVIAKKMAPILDAVAPKFKIDCTMQRVSVLNMEFEAHVGLDPRNARKRSRRLHFRVRWTVMCTIIAAIAREASSLIFAQKMNLPRATLVSSYDEALEFAKNTQEGVAFVGFDADAKVGHLEELLQSTLAAQVFGQVGRTKKAFAYFCWL